MGIFKKEKYETISFKQEPDPIPEEVKREIITSRSSRESIKYQKDSQGISSTNGLVTRHYRQ
jgi:hypothetical protein